MPENRDKPLLAYAGRVPMSRPPEEVFAGGAMAPGLIHIGSICVLVSLAVWDALADVGTKPFPISVCIGLPMLLIAIVSFPFALLFAIASLVDFRKTRRTQLIAVNLCVSAAILILLATYVAVAVAWAVG